MDRTHDPDAPPTAKARRPLPSRVKARLQFTGWLQYLIPATAATVLFLLAGIGWLLGVWRPVLFWLPLAIGALLLARTVFDVVVVKGGLRPREARPPRQDDLGTFDLIRSRRSCRSFQTRDLTHADRTELMRAVSEVTRTDHLIGDRPIRLEYVAAPLTVWPTVGAHEFLVAIAPRDYDRQAVIDVGRSLQQVVLQATRMGVATCWIGPGADQSSVAKELGDRFDPDRDHVVCVCAVGYRSRFRPLSIDLMEWIQHRRLPLSSLFFADADLREPLNLDIEPFSSFGRCYEVCQWSPSSFNAQTTRCSVVTTDTGDDRMVDRVDFGATTASRFYAPVALGIWCANWETGCAALGIPGHLSSATDPDHAREEDSPRYDVSWVAHPTKIS